MSDGETDTGTTSRWCLAGWTRRSRRTSGSLGPADLLVYLDTGTGLDANREYVEEFADAVGAQLWTLRTQESYADRVETDGFPGPAEHGRMYRKLKERQIGRLATLSGGRGNTSDLHLWTGVRRQESERRMANVTPEQDGPGGRGTRRSTTGANRTAASTSTGSTSRKTTCGTIRALR